MKTIVIGSRGSDLALWQANHVQQQLKEIGVQSIIQIIKTQGDIIQHLSFDKMEGKGFFTKEIEAALIDNTIDLAVHSHKDLETTSPEGLIVACVSDRANPSDLLLMNKTSVDVSQEWKLKKNAIIGTSSARRKSLVKRYREDLTIKDLRGNVPTRIQKLRNGDYDSILLAKAGVDRLKIDLSEFEVTVLDPIEFVPAPAQGVLGLQIRASDEELFTLLQKLNNKEVQEQIAIERLVLKKLSGGCQLPLGVYCQADGTVTVSHAPSTAEGADWYQFEFEDLEQAEEIAEIIIEVLLSEED
jgi:hydroxymethylbilane synthase